MKVPLDITKEERRLGALAPKIRMIAGIIGLLGLAGGIAVSFAGPEGGRGFFFSYLLNTTYFLTLSIGALFFVILHHLVRAGWSVVVRRIAEAMAGNLWILGIAFLPLLLFGLEEVYVWAQPGAAEHDHLIQHKQAWLNQPFFIGRVVFYFVVWILLSRYFLSLSTRQDASGDPMLTVRMERFSGFAMVAFALSVSLAGFDLLMSLDPHWYSTMFGVYVFSGSTLGFLAFLPLVVMYLQSRGLLRNAITREHYHDIGKLVFAFTVFWAYIAYSQYMLIWYANIPEETIWLLRRQTNGWQRIGLVLLLGHFIVPFLVLLPRFMKRRKGLLALPAVWILIMHWFDLYWVIMPEMSAEGVPFGLRDVLLFVGIGGIYVAGLAHRLRDRALVPERDPRLTESLIMESV
ncbi:MAG: quinol:cytochrome C oxidoreductase [Candidatus Latescibacteria bacterium]|nr:quinol:cytochrome C oxidoreductase [Candidatus Latescibacterota bacterium]